MSAAATALADQLDAATAHVDRGMDRLVTDAGFTPTTTRADPWPLALLADATSDTCPHLAAASAPQPVIVAAHLRRVQCQACHDRTARAMADTLEDATCDRCRTIPVGGHLTTMAAAFGPVFVPLGLCNGCAPAIRADR